MLAVCARRYLSVRPETDYPRGILNTSTITMCTPFDVLPIEQNRSAWHRNVRMKDVYSRS